MVSCPSGTNMRRADTPPRIPGSVGFGNRSCSPAFANRIVAVSRMEVIRRDFRREGFSEPLVNLLVAGNRSSTLSTYESAWRNWIDWCFRRNENSLSVPLKSVLEFLTGLHRDGKSYNSVNVHRSMLSKTLPAVDGHPVGTHPLVKNLLNGCYNLNPPKPKYNCSWDPSIVIQFMAQLGKNESISFPSLTRKTATLLALASLLRVSELAAINFQSINFSEESVKFSLLKPRKAQHSGPLQTISIPAIPEEDCCPVHALKAYVKLTGPFRGNSNINQLFISVISPHGGVTANTISRWIRITLKESGVDTSVFSAHSTRGAAASKASAAGISIDEILKAGHWKTESTFSRFYKRTMEPSIVPAVFQLDGQVLMS
ncbi:hypothetical protein OUZ56_005261 [Daphnia magna]|uniref:Tyr recombinase domain-containing protein n=1 Tax=Daphnia magna TaxID=35525 RepID=A0ABQ9YSA8_9CRUS|nr:hypothetical protein OUZ56_005261 [Daphnia magna]